MNEKAKCVMAYAAPALYAAFLLFSGMSSFASSNATGAIVLSDVVYRFRENQEQISKYRVEWRMIEEFGPELWTKQFGNSTPEGDMIIQRVFESARVGDKWYSNCDIGFPDAEGKFVPADSFRTGSDGSRHWTTAGGGNYTVRGQRKGYQEINPLDFVNLIKFGALSDTQPSDGGIAFTSGMKAISVETTVFEGDPSYRVELEGVSTDGHFEEITGQVYLSLTRNLSIVSIETYGDGRPFLHVKNVHHASIEMDDGRTLYYPVSALRIVYDAINGMDEILTTSRMVVDPESLTINPSIEDRRFELPTQTQSVYDSDLDADVSKANFWDIFEFDDLTLKSETSRHAQRIEPDLPRQKKVTAPEPVKEDFPRPDRSRAEENQGIHSGSIWVSVLAISLGAVLILVMVFRRS